MKIVEVVTDLGRKYQDLYTQYYKRAHRHARAQGMDFVAADRYAEQQLDRYKLRIRQGYDPWTRQTAQAQYR
jgi:hypothetical protein